MDSLAWIPVDILAQIIVDLVRAPPAGGTSPSSKASPTQKADGIARSPSLASSGPGFTLPLVYHAVNPLQRPGPPFSLPFDGTCPSHRGGCFRYLACGAAPQCRNDEQDRSRVAQSSPETT